MLQKYDNLNIAHYCASIKEIMAYSKTLTDRKGISHVVVICVVKPTNKKCHKSTTLFSLIQILLMAIPTTFIASTVKLIISII